MKNRDELIIDVLMRYYKNNFIRKSKGNLGLDGLKWRHTKRTNPIMYDTTKLFNRLRIYSLGSNVFYGTSDVSYFKYANVERQVFTPINLNKAVMDEIKAIVSKDEAYRIKNEIMKKIKK